MIRFKVSECDVRSPITSPKTISSRAICEIASWLSRTLPAFLPKASIMQVGERIRVPLHHPRSVPRFNRLMLGNNWEHSAFTTSYPKQVSLQPASRLLHSQRMVHSCEVWCGKPQRGFCWCHSNKKPLIWREKKKRGDHYRTFWQISGPWKSLLCLRNNTLILCCMCSLH